MSEKCVCLLAWFSFTERDLSLLIKKTLRMGREESTGRESLRQQPAGERRAKSARSKVLRLPKGLRSRAQMKSPFDKQEVHTFPQTRGA